MKSPYCLYLKIILNVCAIRLKKDTKFTVELYIRNTAVAGIVSQVSDWNHKFYKNLSRISEILVKAIQCDKCMEKLIFYLFITVASANKIYNTTQWWFKSKIIIQRSVAEICTYYFHFRTYRDHFKYMQDLPSTISSYVI